MSDVITRRDAGPIAGQHSPRLGGKAWGVSLLALGLIAGGVIAGPGLLSPPAGAAAPAPLPSVAVSAPLWREVDTRLQFLGQFSAVDRVELRAQVGGTLTQKSPADLNGFADVLRFTRKVLIDSVLLFEHWGTFKASVPGVYGIGKNDIEHMMAFYHGAKQTIYGHGSWGLSFSDNHSDLATATIRQALEIRVRRAFGVMAKISKANGSIHPLPFSDLLEAIDKYRANIDLPVRFENIERINGWANMYLHAALKLYAWCPPRVLAFLRVFLLGGQAPGWHHNSKAGVVVDRATFDAVRDLIRQEHEDATFDLALLDVENCEALIR
jgi:hypothetical protein